MMERQVELSLGDTLIVGGHTFTVVDTENAMVLLKLDVVEGELDESMIELVDATC